MDDFNYAYQKMTRGTEEPPPNKYKKIVSILCFVLGALLMIGGFFVVFVVEPGNHIEVEGPMDIYYATETDEYVGAPIQYMTRSIASYEAMEAMQFYIILDEELNPSVVCIYDDELPEYMQYLEFLYTDDEEAELESSVIVGYAQKIDEELKKLVIEGFEENFGTGYVDESNFYDWFGYYYIQVGQKSSSYSTMNAGIGMFVIGIFLLVAGFALKYKKPEIQSPNHNIGPIIQETNKGLGVLGAVIGVLLGGLLWAIVGIMGYVSGWIGILIIVFGNWGYTFLSKSDDTFGKVISFILSVLIIIPATYIIYVWGYYQGANENILGYITLVRAFKELPSFLTKYNEWENFISDIGQGYLFLLIAGAIYIGGSLSSNKKNKKNKL